VLDLLGIGTDSKALRHLVAQVGASQIMLGSDHPIPWEEHPVDHVCATESLTDEENRRSWEATRPACSA
jgi:hypothetical protein